MASGLARTMKNVITLHRRIGCPFLPRQQNKGQHMQQQEQDEDQPDEYPDWSQDEEMYEAYSEWLCANEIVWNGDRLVELLESYHRFDEFLGSKHAKV